jgi:hypothetical protein
VNQAFLSLRIGRKEVRYTRLANCGFRFWFVSEMAAAYAQELVIRQATPNSLCPEFTVGRCFGPEVENLVLPI